MTSRKEAKITNIPILGMSKAWLLLFILDGSIKDANL
jgi:hypothetical protein